jgi:PadR family transcriptional regulator, regulatory protein PadR
MVIRSRRLSAQALAVLAALDRDEWRYGLEIATATGLKSGSLYPLLIRLSERGLLESRWLEPERPGRPARHAYRMTGAGRAVLRQASAAGPELKPQGAF